MKHLVKQISHRLILLLVLLALMAMPVVPPPIGAVEPLWGEAADLRAHKSFAAAVEVYEEIAALLPEDATSLVAVGEIYLLQHRWYLAEDAFNRAMGRDWGNPRALAGLALAHWETGDRFRAVALWEEALAREPNLSDVGVRLALAYLELNRTADAEVTLRTELARAEIPAARLVLGMIVALDDADDARQTIKAIPDDGPPPVVAGRDYMLAALNEAEVSSSAGGRAKSLGLAFTQIGEWQLARMALQRALALDPTDAEAMAYLGHAEAQLGRPAFMHLSDAVTAQPDWALGHYLLGFYYLRQEAYQLAVEEFQVALRLDPGNARAQVELAHAYLGLGQYLAAEEALVGAVESAPNDLTFRLTLARFYADYTFGVAERGLDAAQAAADLAPDDPQARDILGWVYFLLGDPEQARLHLRSALSLDPELVSAHYHLGMVHKALGEEEAARSAFLRVIDLDTSGFYRDRAQKVITSNE